ncbi:MAG: type II secretion system F family protein [Clostridia bacterium]|nr:type II secretion system F family protein [Clostridia bacterium]
MAKYRFSASNKSGIINRGTVDADSLDAARRNLSQQGLFIIELAELRSTPGDIVLGSKKLSLKDLSIFTRQFSTMLTAGVNAIKCLDILYQQNTKVKVKTVLRQVYDGIQRGQTLSEAMGSQHDAFPQILINLIEAGETSGSLDSILARSADSFEKDDKIKSSAKSAMIYPIILAIMTVLVVTFLLTFIVPTFSNLFSGYGATLPLPTRILIALSGFLKHYWYLVIAVIGIIIFLIWFYLKTPNGRMHWDNAKLTMPIVGKLNRTIIAARFARTLSILLHSGIPMLKSLEITGRVLGNVAFERIVLQVRDDVRKGTSLSAAMKKHSVFPHMLCSMIGVGEESGTLDDILGKTSLFYDDESDTAMQRLVALIQPLMIVIMAVVVGFVILSVVLPMVGMMKVIR